HLPPLRSPPPPRFATAPGPGPPLPPRHCRALPRSGRRHAHTGPRSRLRTRDSRALRPAGRRLAPVEPRTRLRRTRAHLDATRPGPAGPRLGPCPRVLIGGRLLGRRAPPASAALPRCARTRRRTRFRRARARPRGSAARLPTGRGRLSGPPLDRALRAISGPLARTGPGTSRRPRRGGAQAGGAETGGGSALRAV